MNSKERLQATLAHQTPDRDPFNNAVCAKLFKYLKIDDLEAEIYNYLQQLALPLEQVLKQQMDVDICTIRSGSPDSFNLVIQ